MRKSVFGVAVAAMALCCLSGHLEECIAAAPQKIGLRVLYIGHPGSARESDFVGFLEEHFAKVGKGDLAKFKEKQADNFDVVIMDYDGRCFDAPRPKLRIGYTRATVTVAGVGGLITHSLRLKTDYL